MKLFWSLIFLPFLSLASVQVAFLETRDAKGNLVALEPGGRFSHVAVSYQGQWLEAHPYFGVHLVSFEKLENMGTVALILNLPKMAALDPAVVQPLLGKAFDHKYSWDGEKFYCSELVGKLLNLKPEPMIFDPALWPPEYEKSNGELGLSPDDIFSKLMDGAN
ncbi:MAG: hypothetical protein ACXWC9_02550 [Pseudobdellovibrionaceae bacterium]